MPSLSRGLSNPRESIFDFVSCLEVVDDAFVLPIISSPFVQIDQSPKIGSKVGFRVSIARALSFTPSLIAIVAASDLMWSPTARRVPLVFLTLYLA